MPPTWVAAGPAALWVNHYSEDIRRLVSPPHHDIATLVERALFSPEALAQAHSLPKRVFHWVAGAPGDDPFHDLPIAMLRHVPAAHVPAVRSRSSSGQDVISYQYTIYLNRAAEELTGYSSAEYVQLFNHSTFSGKLFHPNEWRHASGFEMRSIELARAVHRSQSLFATHTSALVPGAAPSTTAFGSFWDSAQAQAQAAAMAAVGGSAPASTSASISATTATTTTPPAAVVSPALSTASNVSTPRSPERVTTPGSQLSTATTSSGSGSVSQAEQARPLSPYSQSMLTAYEPGTTPPTTTPSSSSSSSSSATALLSADTTSIASAQPSISSVAGAVPPSAKPPPASAAASPGLRPQAAPYTYTVLGHRKVALRMLAPAVMEKTCFVHLITADLNLQPVLCTSKTSFVLHTEDNKQLPAFEHCLVPLLPQLFRSQ